MSSDPGVHESRHPSLKQYVWIAIFLFVVTLVEFVIILPEDFRGQGWTIAPPPKHLSLIHISEPTRPY